MNVPKININVEPRTVGSSVQTGSLIQERLQQAKQIQQQGGTYVKPHILTNQKQQMAAIADTFNAVNGTNIPVPAKEVAKTAKKHPVVIALVAAVPVIAAATVAIKKAVDHKKAQKSEQV